MHVKHNISNFNILKNLPKYYDHCILDCYASKLCGGFLSNICVPCSCSSTFCKGVLLNSSHALFMLPPFVEAFCDTVSVPCLCFLAFVIKPFYSSHVELFLCWARSKAFFSFNQMPNMLGSEIINRMGREIIVLS